MFVWVLELGMRVERVRTKVVFDGLYENYSTWLPPKVLVVEFGGFVLNKNYI